MKANSLLDTIGNVYINRTRQSRRLDDTGERYLSIVGFLPA